MLKQLFLLTLVLTLSLQKTEDPNLTDKEILQQTLNGVFEANKLPDPTTIVTPCIDADTAHKLVIFIGQVLDKAAKGSISDLLSLVQLIKDFGNQIPQAVKDCLKDNAEFKALGVKYGIDDKTDTSALEKKIIAYVTLHYLSVHKSLGDLNNDWKAGKYYNVGTGAAALGHQVLGKEVEQPNLTDKEILQQTLNGVFESNKLPDPTTIVAPCIDDDTAHKLVIFIGQVLDKAARGSISDLLSLVQLIKDFGDQIPQAVKDCLNNNAQFIALGAKYGIDDKTDTAALEKKVIAYVTLHYLSVHKSLGDINNNWKAAKYYDTGSGLASLGHAILGMTIEELKAYRDI